MKKFLSVLATIIGVIALVILAVFLVLKIRNDTMLEKEKDIEKQNIIAESEYLCAIANDRIDALKDNIEKELNMNIEIADVGSLDKMDIYFVTKVDNDYKYIVKSVEDNKDVFTIAQNNGEEAKYIVSIKALGLDQCIYTKLNNYNIDKEGNITYQNDN